MNTLDYLNQIFNKQEPVLKDMFATLFMDILNDIQDGVEIFNPHLIEELKGYPYEMDLSATLGRFTYDHFSLGSIKKISGIRSFSLLNLHGMFNRKPLSHHQDRKRLRGIVSKKYTLMQYQEFSSIAEDLIRWRHKHAHNNVIRNSSQALVVFSQISLFLKIYPDKLREKIEGLNEFDRFINHDCMQSMNLFSSDHEQEPEDDDVFLEGELEDNKIDLINESIQIQESLFNLNLASNDQTQTMHHAIARIENIEKDIQQISIALNETNHYFNKKYEDEVRAREDEEARAKAENEQWHRKHAGEIMEDNVDGMQTLDLIIGDTTVIRLEHRDVVGPASDYPEYRLTEEAQEKYFPSDGDDLKPDLKIVPKAESDKILSEPDQSLQNQDEDIAPLTDAEKKDSLQLLRDEIKQYMKAEYKEFENWNNILMSALVKELINNDFKDADEFKDSDSFRHYYNSAQMRGKSLKDPKIEEHKKNARIFMDHQLDRYWSQIREILDQGSE